MAKTAQKVGISARNHVVPAGYLRGWACDDLIAMRLVGSARPKVVKLDNAGVRVGFYLERAADGTTSDRFEKQLAKVERVLIPAVRELGPAWPPTTLLRGRVAEFMALQTVRTPAWRTFHGKALNVARERLPPRYAHLPETTIAAVADRLRTDQQRHTRLREQVFVLATMIANMHWTLVVCDESLLATADHPVVALPFGDDPVSTTPIPPDGLMNTSEIRFALSPRELLVATWRDEVDATPPVVATPVRIRNHNTLVISQAETQWFHVPGAEVPYGEPPCRPIAADLFPDYDGIGSSRRRHVSNLGARMLDAGPEERRQVLIAEWGLSREPA